MATSQYIVIPALFLAKHTFVTVTQAIPLGPEIKVTLLSFVCLLNPAVGAIWRDCKWWATTAKKGGIISKPTPKLS